MMNTIHTAIKLQAPLKIRQTYSKVVRSISSVDLRNNIDVSALSCVEQEVSRSEYDTRTAQIRCSQLTEVSLDYYTLQQTTPYHVTLNHTLPHHNITYPHFLHEFVE
jgi:hypothetical protein